MRTALLITAILTAAGGALAWGLIFLADLGPTDTTLSYIAAIGPTIALGMLAFGLASYLINWCWGPIAEGTVVEHRFVEEQEVLHMTIPSPSSLMPALAINGYQEPAIAPAHWECLVRNDRGREEWICMGADRSQLPAVGSHYRRGADIA